MKINLCITDIYRCIFFVIIALLTMDVLDFNPHT